MDEMPPAPEVAEAPVAEDNASAAAPAAALAQNLKTMGEKLAAALRAAGSTAEAEAVKTDLRDGMEGMRLELDKALQRVPTAKVTETVQSGVQRSGEVAAGGTQRLRVELAGVLREANRALDNLANALQGEKGDIAGDDEAVGDGPPE